MNTRGKTSSTGSKRDIPRRSKSKAKPSPGQTMLFGDEQASSRRSHPTASNTKASRSNSKASARAQRRSAPSTTKQRSKAKSSGKRPVANKQSSVARSTANKRVAAKEAQVGSMVAIKEVSSDAQERTLARRNQQLSILDASETKPTGRHTGDRKTRQRKSSPQSRRVDGRIARKSTSRKASTAKRPERTSSSKVRETASDESKRAARKSSTRSRRPAAEKSDERASGTARTRTRKTATNRTSKAGRSKKQPKAKGWRNPIQFSLVESLERQRRNYVPRGVRSVLKKSLPVTESGERLGSQLTIVIGGLTLFGLAMVLSASSVTSLYELGDSPFFAFKRQVAWALVGAIAFFVCSRLDYRRLRMFIAPLLLGCAALMIAVLLPGVGTTAGGSTRWLGYGPFLMQPSELVKLAVIIVAADILTRRERRMNRPDLTVQPIMFMVLFFSALLLLQPKLGTALILGAVSLLLLFVAGACWKSLARWIALATVSASVLAYGATYRRERLLVFLNPWDTPDSSGYQVIQSQVSVASGGWFGVGLGASRAKWGFLPTAQSDFIFAIVAEEVGLIGASALIGGFVAIGWLGFRTALAASDRFGTLLAAGITCWILVQAFLNIGMVLSVLPTTGEPLPFVSAGGSSLMTVMAAAGVLTSVARRSNPN